jgi:phenylacetate-CoA ligase
LVEFGASPEDPARIAESLQAHTKLRGTVHPVAIGSLPIDGKLIEDRRPID